MNGNAVTVVAEWAVARQRTPFALTLVPEFSDGFFDRSWFNRLIHPYKRRAFDEFAREGEQPQVLFAALRPKDGGPTWLVMVVRQYRQRQLSIFCTVCC
jgi:hypothetical protein